MKKKIILVIGFATILALMLYAVKPYFFGKSGPAAKKIPLESDVLQRDNQHNGPVSLATGMPAGNEEEEAEAPTVEIPFDKQQLIGVKTATVSIQPMHKTIRTVGIVEYDQRKLSTINTKFEGWVEKLYVNFVGAYVKKGEPVADIYSPELWATQQEFINVLRWVKQAGSKTDDQIRPPAKEKDDFDISSIIDRDARALVEAARQRLLLMDVSDIQIKRIEESGRPIRTLTLYSPYSGYVLQKNINQGMRVMAGQGLLDIVDLSSVWITANIYEFELPLIKVGDSATLQLSTFPEKRFPTRIDYIYPTLESETRTAKVRFILPNEEGNLKPQMFTYVEITINLGKKMVVPADAVINTGVRRIVYIDKGDGFFEPREVTTGVQTDQLVEITAGLKTGDKIASSANFLIDSEAKLKGVKPLPRQGSQKKEIPTQPSAMTTPSAHKH